jgi:hypothetical protein
MRHRLAPLLLLLPLMACTDDSGLVNTTPGDNDKNNFMCPEGERINAITGACEPVGSNNNNNNNNNNLPGGDFADDEQDGVIAAEDNCPGIYNPGQTDTDGDGVGDACDNCIATANLDQADSNNDSIGDACTGDPNFYDNTRDTDGDGAPDVRDNCPMISNASQADRDRDGVGDTCDNCVSAPNPSQLDTDNNGVGDACQEDPGGAPVCHTQTFRPDVTTIEPNIYILLDASGSMSNEQTGMESRPRPWPIDVAQEAIRAVAGQIGAEARLGFGIYPSSTTRTAQCNYGHKVNIGDNNGSAVTNAVNALAKPIGDTPTGYALDRILIDNRLRDSSDRLNNQRPKAVMLITDGVPSVKCYANANNPNVPVGASPPPNIRVDAQAEAVAAAARLKAANLPVYVVGFQFGTDTAKLNEIAQAAGTDAMGPNGQRFYTAESATQLGNAMRAIRQQVIACSYLVSPIPPRMDRAFITIGGNMVAESAANGYSFDRASGVLTLNGAACDQVRTGDANNIRIQVDLTCTPERPPEPMCVPEPQELCDYRDNDCDQQVDEGCGSCKPEICDEIDNDCDDQIDEGCPVCMPLGDACSSDGDCCIGKCDDGACRRICRPEGVVCTSSDECCLGICSGSVDRPGTCLSL